MKLGHNAFVALINCAFDAFDVYTIDVYILYIYNLIMVKFELDI